MSFLCEDGPSAPVAPDPTATADAQSAANIKAAFATAKINNPNIVSPYGKSTTQYGLNAFYAANPDAAQAFASNNQGKSAEDFAKAFTADRPGMANPYDEYTPYVTQLLNPESQKIFDTQQKTKQQFADLANLGTSNAFKTLSTPFSFNSYDTPVKGGMGGLTPEIARKLMQTSMTRSGVSSSEFEKYGGYEAVKAVYDKSGGDYSGSGAPYPQQTGNTTIANAGKITQGPIAANFTAGSGPIASNFMAAGGPSAADFTANSGLDLTNVAAMPINAGTTAEKAIMARLEPQIAKQRVSTETQLINQGLRPGSEAYNNAITLLGQQENDQRTQAVLQGLGLDISANAQGYGQALTSGQFGNTAQAQNFGQGNIEQQLYNQAQGQNFGQGTTAQNTANQAIGQNYTQNYNTIAQNNAAQQQQFAQNTQQAAFENQARQQALAEAIQMRQMPINEIAALSSGSQIQNPVFQPYTGANVGAAPIAQTMQNAYAGAQNAYNQEMASKNAQTSGLFQLGAAAIGLSDRRLKTNIKRIGTHKLGVGIYEYDIMGKHDVGVMAQEVINVLPEAIHIHSSGYMMVDYGRLNA